MRFHFNFKIKFTIYYFYIYFEIINLKKVIHFLIFFSLIPNVNFECFNLIFIACFILNFEYFIIINSDNFIIVKKFVIYGFIEVIQYFIPKFNIFLIVIMHLFYSKL